MKKVVIISMLFLMTIVTMGQSKWSGFFKPVTTANNITFRTAMRNRVEEGFEAEGKASVWLFRPVVTLSAVQFTWDVTSKQFNSSAFSSTGMGISYAHYIDVNNAPYNNFGFNLLVLMNTSDTENPASVSLAGTVSALKFVSLGAGYDLGRKVFFMLTGVSYSF